MFVVLLVVHRLSSFYCYLIVTIVCNVTIDLGFLKGKEEACFINSIFYKFEFYCICKYHIYDLHKRMFRITDSLQKTVGI